MKKTVLVIIICSLLAVMPISMGMYNNILIQNCKQDLTEINPISKIEQAPVEEPPNWANGNFSGIWGLDIWGETHLPLGWMFGYYKRNPNIGYFYAGFESFWGENDTWFIQGYFFGPFMFGSLGENEYANESLFVGLGSYNNTNYHWRLMGQTGPTFFMYGEYTKF